MKKSLENIKNLNFFQQNLRVDYVHMEESI